MPAKRVRAIKRDTRKTRLCTVSLQQQLEQRTRELDAALEQQTATAEILRIISRSPADVRPVFDSIVLAAVRLLRCDRSFFLRCDGSTYSPMSIATLENGLSVDVDATRRLPIDPTENFPSRAIVEKKTLYLPDTSLMELPKHERRVYEKYGCKTGLFLPLIRGEECSGILVFAGKQANIPLHSSPRIRGRNAAEYWYLQVSKPICSARAKSRWLNHFENKL